MANSPQTWFSDDPDASAADALGRSTFLEKVESTIRDASRTESSTVFALIGPWGSGKTSILDRLRSQLRNEVDGQIGWKFVTFSPWSFQELASLQLGFFAELARAFDAEPSGSKIRKRIAKFGETVAPITSLTAAVGVDPSEAISGVARLIAGDQSVTAQQKRLEKILREAALPVLVVIDDLDRLSAEELLLTLKLVRLLGRLPHVNYLLSYDESTILDVLTRTSLIGRRSIARARDYLEKVVQVRFDVPEIRPSDRLELVNSSLRTLSEAVEIDMTDDEQSRFSSAYFSFLQSRLSTPRAIRRYFAQSRLLATRMRGEIDFADFLTLTWIRTAEPGAYALVQRRRTDLIGNGRRWTFNSDTDERSKALKIEWTSLLTKSGTREEDLDSVAAALAHLFPRFSAIWGEKKYSPQPVKPLRLAHEDYFDRYFSLGVPRGDISDSVVANAVADVRAGRNHEDRTPSMLLVDLALIESPALVVAKIAREFEGPGLADVDVLLWLERAYYRLSDVNDFVTPRDQISSLVTRELRKLDEDGLVSAILALGEEHSPYLLIRALVDAIQYDDSDGSGVAGWGETARAKLANKMQALFAVFGANLDAIPQAEWLLVWYWLRIDEESVKLWLRDQEGVWDLLDMASRFVESQHSVGVQDPVHRLSGADLTMIDRLFGDNRIDSLYSEEIDSAGPVPDLYHGPTDSAENRRALLLSLLKARRPPEAG